MKKQVIYAVELTNLDTFESYPGADAFARKWAAHWHDAHLCFRFDLESHDWQRAVADLRMAHLRYQTFYGIELPPEEMASHPAFYMIIPALYDAVTGDNRLVLSKEVAGFPIAQDFHNGRIVAQADLVRVIITVAPKLKLERGATVKNKKYQLLGKLPQLAVPQYKHAPRVKQNLGDGPPTFYPDGGDGVTSLSAEGVAQLAKHHLMASWLFTTGTKTYRQNTPHYLVSGPLAAAIYSKFAGKIKLTPMTFDLVGKRARRKARSPGSQRS